MSADLASLPDFALAGCPTELCDSGDVCVFFARGDCSQWDCVTPPAACAAAPDCGCLGDAFCQSFAMGDEQLTCTPPPDFMAPNVVVCTSTILCI